MSDSLGLALAVFFGEVVPAGVSLYAAYWAFTIRKALASRVYRNQALWLGAFCFLFAISNFVHPFNNSEAVAELTGTYYTVFWVIIFAWIDSTILVARRSDPLLRSILHWEKLRLVVWAGLLGIGIPTLLYFGFQRNFITNPSVLFYILLILFTQGPLVVGAPGVLIGARRSRDPVLRGSLRWFGIFLLMLLLLITESAVVENAILGVSPYDTYYSYPALPGAVFFTLAAYALYKSARSLASTSRLPAIESVPISSTGTFTTIQGVTFHEPSSRHYPSS